MREGVGRLYIRSRDGWVWWMSGIGGFVLPCHNRYPSFITGLRMACVETVEEAMTGRDRMGRIGRN